MEQFLLRRLLHLPKLRMGANVAATANQGNAKDAKVIHRHAVDHLTWRAAVLDWRPLWRRPIQPAFASVPASPDVCAGTCLQWKAGRRPPLKLAGNPLPVFRPSRARWEMSSTT